MNINDIYRPLLRYFRKRRMRRFWLEFHLEPSTKILDVGGSIFNWKLLPEKVDLTILNIHRPGSSDVGLFWIIADAKNQPFIDNAFDVVYSNSVIEHLENLENQRLFASECTRVGMRCYIQTPNRRFPVEPHLITPFIHWLPRRIQKYMLRNFTVWGWITRPERQSCDNFLREVRLLDKKEFQELFPDSEIWEERILGLVKSLIAVKR